MGFSRFNVFSKIRDSENYFIVNLLSGSADLLTPEEACKIVEGHVPYGGEYLEKGYLVDRAEEERRYHLRYLDFLDQRDRGEVQIFFVPTYACNFNCEYCYQSEYDSGQARLTEKITDAFFRYVQAEFAGRAKYITLFGGEPLLPDEHSRRQILHLVEEARKRSIDLAVVTNGYHLEEYLPLFSGGGIREIQITLDGTGDVHDARRPLKDGRGTFERIASGIDCTLRAGHTVNLRVVLDAENIESLPELARFASQMGWIGNPRFKTQLGRNYELHTCQAERHRLFSRVAYYEKLYELLQSHPEVGAFHRPAFSLSRFLFENGELPDPLFDACPACKTEWAFDCTGHIYGCTATVGKRDESLGTFYPRVSKDEERIRRWQERDVRSIPECRACGLQLSCGGGCGAVAQNRNGSILSPDCRPEKELMAMGISLYFEKGVFDVGEDNLHQCCAVR